MSNPVCTRACYAVTCVLDWVRKHWRRFRLSRFRCSTKTCSAGACRPVRSATPTQFDPTRRQIGAGGGNEAAEASGVEGRVGDLASLQAATIVNAVQAPKRAMQEPTRRESREGRRRWETSEQSHRSCRGIGDGMQTKGTRVGTPNPQLSVGDLVNLSPGAGCVKCACPVR